MFQFSGRATRKQFLIGGAVRCVVLSAVFGVAMFVSFHGAGDCSTRAGACGGGFGLFLFAYLVATGLFILSIMGLAVRRARDAGWHPAFGVGAVLLAVFLASPFAIHVPGLSMVVVLLKLPLMVVPYLLLIPGLVVLYFMVPIMCVAPSDGPVRWSQAANRPPRIG